MEERSLRITGANTTFFNKITNALTKMLTPTKIGINGMLISMKRKTVPSLSMMQHMKHI